MSEMMLGKGVHLSSVPWPAGQSPFRKVLIPLNAQVVLGERHITIGYFAFSIICVNEIKACVLLGLYFFHSYIDLGIYLCSINRHGGHILT